VPRLLLIDDHAAFRECLALLLDRQPDLEVVAQCGSLADCRDLGGGLSDVDVALLDLALPDGDGAELIEVLRGTNHRVKVLILSANVEPDLSARMAGVCADGVLEKTTSPAGLTAEVRRVARG
jgi:DNA-binding NarL/FixJ family response regulator